MSNNRYIELDSTYRDRKKWPLSGQFEVPISQSGQRGKYNAFDPVSLAAPIEVWTSNEFVNNTTTPTISTTFISGSKQSFIVSGTPTELQPIKDYYKQALISTTTPETTRILSYRYLGNDQAEIIVEPSFTSIPVGDTLTITDSTNITGNTNYPLIFVPKGRKGSNAYQGKFLYNNTVKEYRPITNYDVFTHLLQIDTTGSVVSNTYSGPVTSWQNEDSFNIRKEVPSSLGTVVDYVTGSPAVVAIPTSTIIPFDTLTSSSIDDFYTRNFIRMTSGPAENEMRLIVKYTSNSVYSVENPDVGNLATVSPPFSSTPLATNTFEILQFSYDNAHPFVYTGSSVSQQQEVCYEIELLNLVLPNQTLSVGNGSRITFYPYVYVEFVNTSGSNAGTKNVIYSNNPNSTRMLFRAAIDDISNPIFSTFLKIHGDGMVQTVKFKPNDNLRFSVTLPNGEIYDTIIEETDSPEIPNDQNQISALFRIKRL
jgi:hypothetical protein